MKFCKAGVLCYPDLKEISPGWWELQKDYTLGVGNDRVDVPKGFQCDLASVPSGLQFWYGTPGSTQNAAAGLCHDKLYTNHMCAVMVKGKWVDMTITRKEADDILYNILIMFGHSRYSAYKMWLGVRMFGGSHWKSLSAKYTARMKSMGETQ